MKIWLCLFMMFALASCSGSVSQTSDTSTQQNSSPTVSTSDLTVAENGTSVGVISASDPDNDDLSFTLEGPDAALFSISGNQLSFVVAPNFERPDDEDGDNVYRINVVVSDGMAAVTASIDVTVTDVDELPEGITSFSVTTNGSSARLADFSTDEGTAFTVMGQRNEAGLATSIDAVSIRGISSEVDELDGTNVQVATDSNGRLEDFFFETGDRVGFTYRSDGRISGISVTDVETGNQEIVVVRYDDDDVIQLQGLDKRPASIQSTQIRRRSGGLSVVSTDYEEHCEALGMKASPAVSATKTAQSDDPNVSSVDIRVTECGNPISGANVFLVKDRGSLAPTYPARFTGDGVYTAQVPIATGIGADFEDGCVAVIDVVNTTCSAFGDATGLNPTVVGGLTASCVRFINPLAVAACEAAVAAAIAYCEFGAPITDLVKEDLCESAREDLDLPSDNLVPFYAVAYLPSGGSARSATQSVRASDPLPDFFIDNANIFGPALLVTTLPGDPAPDQDYQVAVSVSCRANATSVEIGVTGTDGFQDSTTCQIENGQGGCTLLVPGAEGGVVDTITIVAGSERRTVRVVF